MPTYEYQCTQCGHAFEIMQKINDLPLEKCPKCNKKLKKLISGSSGLIFKGSGFYATDYAKKSGAPSPASTCPHAKKGCNACHGS